MLLASNDEVIMVVLASDSHYVMMHAATKLEMSAIFCSYLEEEEKDGSRARQVTK